MSGIKRFLPLIVILALVIGAFVLGIGDYLTIDQLRDNRETLLNFVEQHFILAVLAFILAYAVAVAVSIPGASFLTLLGGFLFGTWLGGCFVVVAATMGAVAIFSIARTALGERFRSRAGPWMQKIQEGFQKDGTSYMLVLRLVPLFPFWLVNLVPALLGVSLKTFALATFFGIMPASFVFASLGSGLGVILDDGQEPNLKLILEPHILGPLIGLALLAMVPVIYRKWRERQTSQRHAQR